MANVQKYTRADVGGGSLTRHYERAKDENGNYHKWGNQDIDPGRSHLNYNLGPDRYVEVRVRESMASTVCDGVQEGGVRVEGGNVPAKEGNKGSVRGDEVYGISETRIMSQAEFIAQRLSEVKCHKRDDVNIMCSWIVTAPKGLGENEYEKFFQEAYDFLNQKYGGGSKIGPTLSRVSSGTQSGHSSSVDIKNSYGDAPDSRVGHGLDVEINSTRGNLYLSEKNPVNRITTSRSNDRNVISAYVHMDETTPHMHYAFIPVVVDKKKGHEKVSAKEALGWSERGLHKFHHELDAHMTAVFGRDIGVLNEATKDGNKSIDELKRGSAKSEFYAMQNNVSELRSMASQMQVVVDDLKTKRSDVEGQIEAIQTQLDLERQNLSDLQAELHSTQLKHDTTVKDIKDKIHTELQLIQQKHEMAVREVAENLQATIRPIEGRIAHEKRINKLEDGIKEKKSLFGDKTSVVITVDDMTADEAKTVFSAARDRDKMRIRRDFAIKERDRATVERDAAIKEKGAMERELAASRGDISSKEHNLNAMMQAARGSKEQAEKIQKEAHDKRVQADSLYQQQLNLNQLYAKSITDLDNYKSVLEAEKHKAVELANENSALRAELNNSHEAMTDVIKAVGMLKYDDGRSGYKISTLTSKQGRLIDSIANYGSKITKTAGRIDLAEEIDKRVGVSKEIEIEIKALEPKRDRGYER